MLGYVVITDVILGAMHNPAVRFIENDFISEADIAVSFVGAMVLIPLMRSS